MSRNEAQTRYELIDPVLRDKGYVSGEQVLVEEATTPPPVDATGAKGRRRRGKGRTDYLLCVKVGDQPKALPVGVLEAKKENADPLEGMQQAKNYADCLRYDVKYVFSTNGHLYGEFDCFSSIQEGPLLFKEFPAHAELTSRYATASGIPLSSPETSMLFMGDSPAWSETRYYQDAAIRAAFGKIIQCRQTGEPARVLLSLATGSGKTIIATNLLWRLQQAGELSKPALFICDRDELREQAYNKIKPAFGDSVRIVENRNGANTAKNARIHIATYQTLGLDDEDADFASFLTRHYGDDAFSVIIIDECHRSAWGKWAQVLKRNPGAIQIGLTATPRQLHESEKATDEDREITANNYAYFGEPVYEYTLVEAQDDGYLAACEILQRKASIDKCTLTRDEILSRGAIDIRTGQPLTRADLAKDEYTCKHFDDKLFIDLRTPAMCRDLFSRLCENGGPEQKVIIFCTREIHADRVAMQMNNLYANWCRENGHTVKDHYAFKCMGGPNKGAHLIEPMRGSGKRAFIACTVDLLEAGVDIERLNAVVFFRYLESPIKFYQMVGRGTRIHKATDKYKFWLYDYTDVTRLFGTDFITRPRPRGTGSGGDDPEPPEPPTPPIPPVVGLTDVDEVEIYATGHQILGRRNGRDVLIPIEEYRREIIERILSEAHDLDEFRELWIEAGRRRDLIDHLLQSHLNPEILRKTEKMDAYDLFDCFAHYGYRTAAIKRLERGNLYRRNNRIWFDGMDHKAARVVMELGSQFAAGGTEALETPALWEVPAIKRVGGINALRPLGNPADTIHEAKVRLFGV